MPAFTAKDIQALRRATGAGMLDTKRALEENDGDMEAAKQWLREKGLAGAAKLAGREATQGAVALAHVGSNASLVELRCETDFVAMSEEFVTFGRQLAESVASKGESAVADAADTVDELKTTLKENISVGQAVRFELGDGSTLGTYLHMQSGRGVNGVLSRNEGKPDAALPKIVEGRMNGWFKERCLLEQAYAKDDKRSIADLIGSAEIVRFAQVVVGG